MKAVGKIKSIKVVAEQEAQFAADPAVQAMQNILQAQSDIDVVTTDGDQMTFGAEQAIKSAGRKGIALTGNGGGKLGLTAIRAGRWCAPCTRSRTRWATKQLSTRSRRLVVRNTPAGQPVHPASEDRHRADRDEAERPQSEGPVDRLDRQLSHEVEVGLHGSRSPTSALKPDDPDRPDSRITSAR